MRLGAIRHIRLKLIDPWVRVCKVVISSLFRALSNHTSGFKMWMLLFRVISKQRASFTYNPCVHGRKTIVMSRFQDSTSRLTFLYFVRGGPSKIMWTTKHYNSRIEKIRKCPTTSSPGSRATTPPPQILSCRNHEVRTYGHTDKDTLVTM